MRPLNRPISPADTACMPNQGTAQKSFGSMWRRGRVPVAAAIAAGICMAGLVPSATAVSGWSSASDPVMYSSPAMLKNGSQVLVVTSDNQGWLTARNGGGSVVWKVAIDPVAGQRASSNSSPSVGDINGDGSPEIVVGAGGINPKYPQANGGVVAFRADGSVLWRFRTKDTFNTYTGRGPDGYSDGVFSSPAIGDVDGDGKNDVTFGSFDHFVYSLDGSTGKNITTPYDNWDTIFSTPSLVNIDSDPAQEILIGGDATPNSAIKWTAKGVLRALDPTTNGFRQLWSRQFNDVVAGSPAVGDINDDGRLEAVFSTGGFYNDPTAARQVWAVDVATGKDVAGFPVTLDKPTRTHVALGQLIPGGGLEIALGDQYGGVYAYNGSGGRIWKGRINSSDALGPGYGNQGGGDIIADVNGDGKQEVVVPNGHGGVSYLNGQNGAMIADHVGTGTYAMMSAPAVVNFGSQGGRQLVMAGLNPANNTGQVIGVPLPSTSVGDSWPTFHQTPDRIGAPAPTRTTENLKLAQSLYADMLGRDASSAELAHWAKQMTLTGSRGTGARGFENSTEYRRKRTATFYTTILGRSASGAETSDWASQIAAGKISLDQLQQRFMSSREFYTQGGGTTDGFISMLYQRVLDRSPSASEVAHWKSVLAQSGGQATTINGVYNSAESARLRVDASYQAWLGRSAASSERAYWTSNVIKTGDEGMRRQVMISQEYCNRAQTRSY